MTADRLSAATRLAFGDFVLEPTRKRLLRVDGTPVELPARHQEALQLLVARAGELLDKEQLLARLWPGLVVEENNLNQLVAHLRRALGDRARASRYIQTVPGRGFRFVAEVSRHAAPEALPLALPRLAVLPFKPLATDDRDELLEAGMADSLIARLSTLPGLAVLSIGSVRRFAGPQQDPLAAAQALGADWVVDGSLQRAGDQLRVSARLLRSADGTAAWSAALSARAASVFELQDEVGAKLAVALAPALQSSRAGPAPATEIGGTRNVEAYRCFLQGSVAMQLQRADELRDSIRWFNRALDADPGYARAWVGLADAYRRLSFVGGMPPAAAYAEVEIALRRAEALAPTLGETCATRGVKLCTFDFDWNAGERALRRAIELNPNLAQAWFTRGQFELVLRGDEAGFERLRRACELDPLQPLYAALEASFLRVAGRDDEARARLQQLLEAAPMMPLAQLVRALAHLDAGEHAPGLDALRQAVARSGGATVFDGLLGHYLGRLGQAAEARAILDALLVRQRSAYVAPTTIALVHAGLGDSGPALAALEQGWLLRDARLGFIKDQPYWTGLQGEPRFRTLLHRLGLDRFGPGLWNP